MKKLITTTAAVAMLAACAKQPEQVVAAPVSTLPYQGLSCRALAIEEAQIVEHVHTLTGAQKKKANADAAIMAVGVIVFWPALFALAAGTDQEAALSRAKGEYEAIQKAKAAKRC